MEEITDMQCSDAIFSGDSLPQTIAFSRVAATGSPRMFFFFLLMSLKVVNVMLSGNVALLL